MILWVCSSVSIKHSKARMKLEYVSLLKREIACLGRFITFMALLFFNWSANCWFRGHMARMNSLYFNKPSPDLLYLLNKMFISSSVREKVSPRVLTLLKNYSLLQWPCACSSKTIKASMRLKSGIYVSSIFMDSSLRDKLTSWRRV